MPFLYAVFSLSYIELECIWEVMCEKFEERLGVASYNHVKNVFWALTPIPHVQLFNVPYVLVLVCLCLPYLLVELIVMILIQGKDPSTNWILPIPLNWMIHFSLSQAMIAPKKKIHSLLLLLPLPKKRLTQAILLTSVL